MLLAGLAAHQRPAGSVRDARLILVGEDHGYSGEFMAEADLVAEANSGADGALVALYRRFHPSLVRYLRSYARGEEEDLASEVWIDAARCLEDFQGDTKAFGSLVFTIAHRRAIDHGRKKARRRTDPTDVSSLPVVVGDYAGPEGTVIGRLDGDRAVDEIRRLLSAELAEIVLLRVVAGLSINEVADIVGRRPGTVSVLQHRALRRLAGHLQDTRPRSKGGERHHEPVA
jgi:RNA polymerase sigma-70 factor, ECF subfamily